MGLKKKVVKGSFFTMLSQVIVQIISFGVTIFLARTLQPEDFGIVALSAIFVGFVGMFSGLGMGAAIIQRQNINDDYLSTSFWVGIFAGIAIALILVIISPMAANFYDKSTLKYIVIVSSIGFLLGPFTSIHTTILTKRFEFKKLAFIAIAARVISAITSISIALMGFGVWSLVLGGLVSQALLIPIVWHMVKWKPRFIFIKKYFKDLFGFSSNLLAFDLFNYFSRNFDNIIIGKLLGASVLGYYSMAYSLMMKPLRQISWTIGRVLFPAFSDIQDDKKRVRSAYIKVIRSISLITFPMMIGLMIVAKEFILTCYGIKWEPVVVPLQLLCINGALQSIGTTVGTVFNSQGRPDINLKWGIFASTVYIIAFWVGIKVGGLIGLVIAYVSVGILMWPLIHYIANRLISLNMRNFFNALLPATVCSVLMAVVLLLFKLINDFFLHLNVLVTLVTSIVLGAVFYTIFVLTLFKIPEVKEALGFMKQKFAVSAVRRNT